MMIKFVYPMLFISIARHDLLSLSGARFIDRMPFFYGVITAVLSGKLSIAPFFATHNAAA